MVDIIIPVYNSRKTLPNALASIYMQTFRDQISVTVVNDGGEESYGDICGHFKKMGMNIRILKMTKNRGPGIARQVGMEHTHGEYIMFVDSDDCFYTPLVVENLVTEMNSSGYNAISSNFVEQSDSGYLFKNTHITWVFGKIYRRSFIEDNHISFKFPYPSANEDVAFNFHCFFLEALRLGYDTTETCPMNNVDIYSYLWKNNKESITRKTEDFAHKDGFFGFVENMMCLLLKLRKRFGIDRTLMCAYEIFTVIYQLYNKFLVYNECDDETLNAIEEEIRRFFKIGMRDYTDNLDRIILAKRLDKNKIDFTSTICPKITIEDFLSKFDC